MPCAPRLLVVDDDADVRGTLAEVLAFAGYEVVMAESGEAALKALRRDPRVSLILLDLMMSGLSGRDFRARQLADPSLAEIPVLVLSGRERGAQRLGDLSAAEALEKPLDLDRLLAAVRRAMRTPPDEGALP